MRFFNYINEDANVEKAKKEIAKRIKINPNGLKFIGKEKYDSGTGYFFNVIDKNHKEYKSTKMEIIK